MSTDWIIIINTCLFGLGLWILYRRQYTQTKTVLLQLNLIQERAQQIGTQRETMQEILKNLSQAQQEHYQRFDGHQLKSLSLLQESLRQGITSVQQQVNQNLSYQTDRLVNQVSKLMQETETRLKYISDEVDRRLLIGFEKTTSTFLDVINRLAIIDEAQKKITQLSNNVLELQEILSDKRSRGAFGEVQLSHLICNMLPEKHYAFQHTLSNGKRCDCILFLPAPTGNIVIDAKFPLESYQKMHNTTLSETERRNAFQQLKLDLRKHIRDIAEKYILPNETAEGAVMFIPAEAVFSEIHANHGDIVEIAHRARVWLVSPSTLMAVLTTARGVIKDADTRKQIHIIQEHLVMLGKEFIRFQKRMDNLARHIGLAHQDISEVHLSSKKISTRFHKIEKVELEDGGHTPV